MRYTLNLSAAAILPISIAADGTVLQRRRAAMVPHAGVSMDMESIRYGYLRRIVAPVLRALGIDASLALARWLARGVFNLNTPGRRIAETRLRAARGPAKREGGAEGDRWAMPTLRDYVPEVVAAMYDHIARFWVEALFARRLLRDSSWRKFVHVQNELTLQDLAASHRGCLLATAYYGNPAVAALTLGQILRPVHVVVDALAQPELAAWQHELYAHRWVRPITRRDAGRDVPEALRRGEAVLMICEHERRRGPSVPTPFLGCLLNCYPTLGRLARWYDVPIGVVTCRRDGDAPFSFTLALHDIVPPAAARTPSNSASSDDAAIVRRVMATLEREIMREPEQYYWSLPVMDTGAVLSEGPYASEEVSLDGDEEVSPTSRRAEMAEQILCATPFNSPMGESKGRAHTGWKPVPQPLIRTGTGTAPSR